MGGLVIFGLLLISITGIKCNRFPLQPDTEQIVSALQLSPQEVTYKTIPQARIAQELPLPIIRVSEGPKNHRSFQAERVQPNYTNEKPHYHNFVYKAHVSDQPTLHITKPKDASRGDAKIEQILESMKSSNWYFGDDNFDDNKHFLDDTDGFDHYKSSATTHYEGPGQIETIATDSFHKEVPAFDISGFKHHHEDLHNHGEVHYHEHKHVHKHDHKQKHQHKHKQDHKHEHDHKHEAHHKHEHGHKHENQHKHDHHHGHKHEHHNQHKHDHKHGHKHEQHAKHQHQHYQHHKHEHGHKHKHGHKHNNEHKHDHHHGHKHQHHGEHKHHHGHKHEHGHKHGHKHAHEHKHSSHGKHY